MRDKRHLVLYAVAGLVLVCGVFFCYLSYRATTAVQTVTHTTQGMSFEVVKTPEAMERGLGGRPSIEENYGMLFIFGAPGTYGFWMKDMLAPIDIIWLSDNGTIVGIEENVSPDSYPKVFYPSSPVRLVLETKAGESTRKNWKIGGQISLPSGI